MKKNIIAILMFVAAICSCDKTGSDVVNPDKKPVPETLGGFFSVAEGRTVVFSSGNLCLKNGSCVIETDPRGYNSSDNVVFLLSHAQMEACPAGWRVLSASEWKYLLEERSTVGLRFSNTIKKPVKIDGSECHGLFIYPDGYEGKAVTDTCTWKGLAAHGIAYLPALGMMVSDECKGSGRYGYYWAADKDEKDGLCYNVRFSSNATTPFNACGEGLRYAVRLVK